MLAQQKQLISGLIQDAVNAIIDGQNLEKQPIVSLERPRDASHGDIACNIAMQLSKPLKKKSARDCPDNSFFPDGQPLA